MNIKEYLSRFHFIDLKVIRLKDLYDDYIRQSESIPGVSFDHIRVSGTKSIEAPFVTWIHKAFDVENEMNELEKELPFLKIEIMSTIDELEDLQCKRILIYRYIDWMSWKEIADKMYYSTATIRRWHDKSLIKLSEMNNEQG